MRARIKQTMPWLVKAVRWARRMPGARGARRLYADLFAQRIFTNIYRENLWGDDDSRSGTGSNLKGTEVIRRELPQIIQQFEVHSMLDVPCGDFHWMSMVDLGLSSYIGADIVPDLIAANTARFGAPGRQFMQRDVSRDAAPKVDLILCRDLLIHLSLQRAGSALDNFLGSGSTWLAVSTYPHADLNPDELTGGCRPINLQLAPFHFPKPTLLIQEDGDPGHPHYWDKFLGVWQVAELRRALDLAADTSEQYR